MTDVKTLMAEATPLPWTKDSDWFKGPDGTVIGHTGECGAAWGRAPWQADRRLIVYAVNRLPAYEAAVEVLEAIDKQLNANPNSCRYDVDLHIAHNEAREALARLREPVPAWHPTPMGPQEMHAGRDGKP